MKKLLLLILPAVLLAGCSVKEQETEITVFGNPMTAVYTGKVKRKVPNKEGSAVLSDDAAVEGIFADGVFVSGTADEVPYSTTYNTQTITGTYSGEVAETLPSGNGSFESDTFKYEGTWTGGTPDGTGTMTADQFSVGTGDSAVTGSYSGGVNQGLADGTGTFTYQEGNNEIEMVGTFAKNQYDGLMTKTVRYPDTEKSWPVYYRNGTLQDSPAAMIAYLEGMRSESYCLKEAQLSFINDHAALFEGTGNAPDTYSTAFDYESFADTDEPAFIQISNAAVKSVQRYIPYEGADTVTSMIVQNHEGWYHLFFTYAVEDVNNGDTVSICALPLCRSTLTAPEDDYSAIDAAGASLIR
ncbi:MAG: hypothetical protein IJ201_06875 [Solobacterium sp.]|nr:hypothetical protein [Solobacterium sp.]